MLEIEHETAQRFLAMLGAEHTYQVFPEGESSAYPHGWAPHGQYAAFQASLAEANTRQCGVSVVVNQTDGTGRKLENIETARAIFIDIDPEDESTDRAPIPNFGRERWPSAIVRTPRGWHCYWWLEDEKTDWERWDLALAAMTRKWAGDPRLNRATCLRIPGYWHHKQSPARPIELDYLADTKWTLDRLIEAFHLRMEPRSTPASSTRPGRDRPGWVQDAIAGMSPDEKRRQYEEWVDGEPAAIEGSGGHSQLVKIIKMAWNFGVGWDEAWSVVDRYNDRCMPPWRATELRTQFDSAGRSRFDPSSQGTMLWAPARPVVSRVGPQPPEPPQPEHESDGVRRTVSRGHEPPAEQTGGHEPPDGFDGPELPAGGPPGGDPMLDVKSPLETAKTYTRDRHVVDGARTMLFFRRDWWTWNGERFSSITRENVQARLYGYCDTAKTWGATDKAGHQRVVPFNPTTSKVSDIRSALEAVSYVNDDMTPPCWLGRSRLRRTDPKKTVACRNGLLHLPTREFLGRRPDYLTTTSLGVDYDPNAARPKRWTRFLDELWPDDGQSHRLLQEWFGLSLVPDTSFHKALLIVGQKRSGKGTIARVLNALHGERNGVAWPSLTDLVSRFGLQGLIDKTVAIIPDLRVSARLDTQQAIERFLQITGEDPLQIDRKNRPVIQAVIPARFLLLSNLPPRLPDAGGAFATRVLALKLEQTFLGREDRFLLEALVKELPGILLWAIEGWSRLMDRGSFEQPGTGKDVLSELAHLSNPITAFVEDVCELDPSAETYTDELFLQWRKWCDGQGKTAVGEKATFIRNLRAAHPELQATRPTNNQTHKRVRALRGIGVLYSEQQSIPGSSHQ